MVCRFLGTPFPHAAERPILSSRILSQINQIVLSETDTHTQIAERGPRLNTDPDRLLFQLPVHE